MIGRVFRSKGDAWIRARIAWAAVSVGSVDKMPKSWMRQ